MSVQSMPGFSSETIWSIDIDPMCSSDVPVLTSNLRFVPGSTQRGDFSGFVWQFWQLVKFLVLSLSRIWKAGVAFTESRYKRSQDIVMAYGLLFFVDIHCHPLPRKMAKMPKMPKMTKMVTVPYFWADPATRWQSCALGDVCWSCKGRRKLSGMREL